MLCRVIDELELDHLVCVISATALVCRTAPTFILLLGRAHSQKLWIGVDGAVDLEHSDFLVLLLVQDLQRHRVRQVVE